MSLHKMSGRWFSYSYSYSYSTGPSLFEHEYKYHFIEYEYEGSQKVVGKPKVGGEGMYRYIESMNLIPNAPDFASDPHHYRSGIVAR